MCPPTPVVKRAGWSLEVGWIEHSLLWDGPEPADPFHYPHLTASWRRLPASRASSQVQVPERPT